MSSSTLPATLPPIDNDRRTGCRFVTLMTPAWIVCAWPPVLWQVDETAPLHLVHLGTRVLHFGNADGPRTGQTLWAETSAEPVAGVAWDWVEVEDGVVAMADPLGVVTNLKLLDARGVALNDFQVAVHLNGLVHGLPWQTEVQRAIHHLND